MRCNRSGDKFQKGMSLILAEVRKCLLDPTRGPDNLILDDA